MLDIYCNISSIFTPFERIAGVQYLSLAAEYLFIATMASKSAADPHTSPPSSPSKSKVDPILRNALRYTLSKEEYDALYSYVRTRAPKSIQRRARHLRSYSAVVQKGDDYTASTVRASLRVFILSQAGLKVWDLISTHLLSRKKASRLQVFKYERCFTWGLMIVGPNPGRPSSTHPHYGCRCLSPQSFSSIGFSTASSPASARTSSQKPLHPSEDGILKYHGPLPLD